MCGDVTPVADKYEYCGLDLSTPRSCRITPYGLPTANLTSLAGTRTSQRVDFHLNPRSSLGNQQCLLTKQSRTCCCQDAAGAVWPCGLGICPIGRINLGSSRIQSALQEADGSSRKSSAVLSDSNAGAPGACKRIKLGGVVITPSMKWESNRKAINLSNGNQVAPLVP